MFHFEFSAVFGAVLGDGGIGRPADRTEFLVHLLSNDHAPDRAGRAADGRARHPMAGLMTDDSAQRRPGKPADHRPFFSRGAANDRYN